MATVLGIDPGLRKTGMALLDYDTGDLAYAWTITPTIHNDMGIGPVLHQIAQHVGQAITDFEPFDVAIESPISHRSGTTTIRLGQVSGAILASLWARTIDPEMVNNQTRQKAADTWAHGTDLGTDPIRAQFKVTYAKARACAAARLRWSAPDLTPDEADACWIAAVALDMAHAMFDGDVA